MYLQVMEIDLATVYEDTFHIFQIPYKFGNAVPEIRNQQPIIRQQKLLEPEDEMCLYIKFFNERDAATYAETKKLPEPKPFKEFDDRSTLQKTWDSMRGSMNQLLEDLELKDPTDEKEANDMLSEIASLLQLEHLKSVADLASLIP